MRVSTKYIFAHPEEVRFRSINYKKIKEFGWAWGRLQDRTKLLRLQSKYHINYVF